MADKVFQIRVDAEQAKKATQELADYFEDLTVQAEETGKSLDKVEDSAKSTGQAMGTASKGTTSFLAQMKEAGKEVAKVAGIVTAAIYAVKKLAEEMDRQADIAEAFAGKIDEASDRTRGLISNLDLMLAHNSAAGAGLALSSKQFATLSVAAVKLAEATGTDAASALGTLTTAIATGQERALKPLGINLDGLTDKAEKQAEALSQLHERFGEAAVSADSLGDGLTVLQNNYKNLFTSISKVSSSLDVLASTGGVLSKSTDAFQKYANTVALAATELEKLYNLGRTSNGLRGAEALAAAAKGNQGNTFTVRNIQTELIDANGNPIKEKERKAGAKKDRGEFGPSFGSVGVGAFGGFGQSFGFAQNRLNSQPEPELFQVPDKKKAGGGPLDNFNPDSLKVARAGFDDLVQSMDAASVASSSFADAYSASIEAVVTGQSSVAGAAKAILGSILKSLGREAIAKGTLNVFEGTARALTSYGLDATAGALIGTGTAEIAFGTGLIAGGAAVSGGAPKSGAGGRGGSSGPVRPEGAANSGGKQGGGTVVVNINQPIPEDQIGRTQARYDRAFKRRNGGA